MIYYLKILSYNESTNTNTYIYIYIWIIAIIKLLSHKLFKESQYKIKLFQHDRIRIGTI